MPPSCPPYSGQVPSGRWFSLRYVTPFSIARLTSSGDNSSAPIFTIGLSSRPATMAARMGGFIGFPPGPDTGQDTPHNYNRIQQLRGQTPDEARGHFGRG